MIVNASVILDNLISFSCKARDVAAVMHESKARQVPVAEPVIDVARCTITTHWSE